MNPFAFALLSVSVLFAPLSHAADAPSNGPFVGRLIISILGAGKKPNLNPYPVGTTEHKKFNPNGMDSIEFDALLHLRHFIPNARSSLPVTILGVSSDREFPEMAAHFAKISSASLAGIEPNWVGAFDHLAKDPTSALARTIDAFESTPRAHKLMRSGNLGSVVPLLKVEILMDSEFASRNGEPGIASWSTREKKGSFDDWANDGRECLKKEEWSVLLTDLKGAIVHAFFNSCKSGQIAAAFERAADEKGCYSCFVASTHSHQDDFSGGKIAPTFCFAGNLGLGNEWRGLGPNVWKGAPNIGSMLPDLYQKYRTVILPYRESLGVNGLEYVESTSTRNPLMSFIYTSADALADEGFRSFAGFKIRDRYLVQDPLLDGMEPHFASIKEITTLRDRVVSSEGKDTKSVARLGLLAQSMAELPVLQRQINSSTEIETMLELVNTMEREFGPVLTQPDRPITEEQFISGIDLFTDCTRAHAKNKSPQCEALSEFIDRIYMNGPAAGVQLAFQEKFSGYFALTKKRDPRQDWKAYVGGTKNASEVFENLQAVQKAWSEMKPALSSAIAEQPPELRGPMNEALAYMTNNFEGAYASIRDRLFEDLRKGAIRIKLAKIRLAIQLVGENADALPPGYSEKFMKRMAQKLDCLMQYPMGPAFDAKYGKH